jgi:hypothetical protein
LEIIMKKLFLLSTLALTLAACGGTPKPTTEIQITGTYTYTVTASQAIVSVNPGKKGTKFCYTDKTLNGVQVCNNLTTGTRTVASGYDQGVVFTEPDAK